MQYENAIRRCNAKMHRPRYRHNLATSMEEKGFGASDMHFKPLFLRCNVEKFAKLWIERESTCLGLSPNVASCGFMWFSLSSVRAPSQEE